MVWGIFKLMWITLVLTAWSQFIASKSVLVLLAVAEVPMVAADDWLPFTSVMSNMINVWTETKLPVTKPLWCGLDRPFSDVALLVSLGFEEHNWVSKGMSIEGKGVLVAQVRYTPIIVSPPRMKSQYIFDLPGIAKLHTGTALEFCWACTSTGNWKQEVNKRIQERDRGAKPGEICVPAVVGSELPFTLLGKGLIWSWLQVPLQGTDPMHKE